MLSKDCCPGLICITRNDAVAGTEPDRVFSSEVLFASQNRNVGGLYNSLFNGESLKISSLLGIRNDVAKYRFDNAEESDIRV